MNALSFDLDLQINKTNTIYIKVQFALTQEH